jgi:carbon-monoxide dehydrogenase small subunit
MPEISERFEVSSPVEVVWDFFQDVPAVAACMPGVELGPVGDDGAYAGEMRTKLGPISASFQGTAEITGTDRAEHTGTIAARGVDKRQASRVRATVAYALTAQGTGTAVEVTANITLQGSMAQFGRTGILEEVSRQMTAEFARCLESRLAPGTAEPASGGAPTTGEVNGLRVLRLAVVAWLQRLFRRPSRGEDSRT